MEKIRTIMLACSLLLLSTDVLAVTGLAEGKVQNVYTYGDGRVLVTGFAFPGATCSNNPIAFCMPGDHQYLDRLLSVILTAKATGATLQVRAKIDDCWYPEIEGFGTYVILKDD